MSTCQLVSYSIYCVVTAGLFILRLSSKNKRGDGNEPLCNQTSRCSKRDQLEFLIGVLFNATVVADVMGQPSLEREGFEKQQGEIPYSLPVL